jgi:hypothetical protein
MVKMYCYRCKIEKELTEFKKKSNGYYPKNCILCSDPNSEVIIYPMTDHEENQILDFMKVQKIMVYKSLFEWATYNLLYRSTIKQFKIDIASILKKNKIRKKDITFKGICPITYHKFTNSQAFKIWVSEHK